MLTFYLELLMFYYLVLKSSKRIRSKSHLNSISYPQRINSINFSTIITRSDTTQAISKLSESLTTSF